MSIQFLFHRRTLPGALGTILVAVALAAPTAIANPAPPPYPSTTWQDLRSPDARDAARAATSPDASAAKAQEKYYSSYGNPTPVTSAAAVAHDTGDGIARLPFVLAVLGALIVGLGAGSGLQLVQARRRHATSLAT